MGLDVESGPQNHEKYLEKLFSITHKYQLPKFHDKMMHDSKDTFKNVYYPNTHALQLLKLMEWFEI